MMTSMRAFRAVLLVSFGILAVIQLAAQAPRPLGKETSDALEAWETISLSPEVLLLQSDRMGATFSADDRCFQLFRLSEVASELGSASSRELVNKWSTALFRAATERPRDWNRGAFEKNAAVMLAYSDPDEALHLLEKVDPPDLSSHPPPPEDLRAFGARTVFALFWSAHGLKGLAQIREAAVGFGRNGQYPYPAMALILGKLGTTDREQESAQEVFNEALGFYREGTVIRSADRDFLEFIETRWDSMDRLSKLAAVRAAVSKLTEASAKQPTTTFASRVVTDSGAAAFDTERMLVLYRLMPRIKEIDQPLASRLEGDYPALTQGAGANVKVKSISQIEVEDTQGTAPKESVDAIVGKGLQSGILQQVRSASAADPTLAIKLLAQLRDTEFRSEGMASIAAALWAQNPKAAHSMLESAILTADSIPADLPGKARSCLSAARAASAMKEDSLFKKAIEIGFAAGLESVSEDLDIHPGQPVYMAKGMEQLSWLMELDMRIDLRDAITRVEQVQDGELKAFLLIDCAQGLAHRST